MNLDPFCFPEAEKLVPAKMPEFFGRIRLETASLDHVFSGVLQEKDQMGSPNKRKHKLHFDVLMVSLDVVIDKSLTLSHIQEADGVSKLSIGNCMDKEPEGTEK